MKVDTGHFWNKWKSFLLLVLFQVVFHPMIWATEKVGYETGDYSLLMVALIVFGFVFWGLPIVIGIFSRENKLMAGLRFFVFNSVVFFGIMFFLGYYINITRGVFPTW